MKNGFPQVPLGEVVSHRKEFIEIEDTTVYKRCRVKLHTKGIILRDEVEGARIKTKKQQVCRSNEFLVAEIDAKVGGFGMVPSELDGAIVSSHYFLFPVQETKLDHRFLGYFVRTPYFRDQVKARGSTNYAAIRPNHVLGYEIPLPPLAEQRRIVAKIDHLAAKIEEANRLRERTRTGTSALIASDYARVFSNITTEHGSVLLDQLIEDAGYGTSTKCIVERSGRDMPILRIPNISSEAICLQNLKYAELNDRERAKVTLSGGDILIVRTNGSADLVGRCAVIESLPEPTGFASYLIRIKADEKKVAPHYLQRVLRYLRNSGYLFDFARTTAGQYNVSLGRLRGAAIPLPPIGEQHRIVAALDGLQAKIDELKRLQEKTATELDALLPSILDRAFKGEL